MESFRFDGLPTAVTGVQGIAADGRHAWLISLRRREWCVVDDGVNAQLERERQRFWLKGLYLLIILLVLNPLLDAILDTGSSPWLALILAWLHLLQENRDWARRLRALGGLQVGGVTPVDVPKESFWHVLAQLPFLLALTAVLGWWQPPGMALKSFTLLMLVFWLLVALEIHHVRTLRSLNDDISPDQSGRGVDEDA